MVTKVYMMLAPNHPKMIIFNREIINNLEAPRVDSTRLPEALSGCSAHTARCFGLKPPHGTLLTNNEKALGTAHVLRNPSITMTGGVANIEVHLQCYLADFQQ